MNAKYEIEIRPDEFLPTNNAERVEWFQKFGIPAPISRVVVEAPLKAWAEAGAEVGVDGAVRVPTYSDGNIYSRLVKAICKQARETGIVSEQPEAAIQIAFADAIAEVVGVETIGGHRTGQARIDLFARLVQLGSGAGQNLGLNVEFFPGDQVQLSEKAGKHGLDVLFQVGGRGAGQEGAQPLAEIFEKFGIEHDAHPGVNKQAAKCSTGGSRGCRTPPHRSCAHPFGDALPWCGPHGNGL